MLKKTIEDARGMASKVNDLDLLCYIVRSLNNGLLAYTFFNIILL